MVRKNTAKALEQKVAQLTEALQRERADSVNLRRRTENERARMADFYKAVVVRELLPAVDNLERALKHAPRDLANHDYVKGVQGVIKQFERCLASLGVERIKTIGEHFDPRLHEAVGVEDAGGHQEIISEEMQAGYKISDEIIRHAMVKVVRK